ncbi:MAG: glycosyl hydrolase family 18 protein, partial [Cellulosilyticaceae bacterium]
MKNKKFKVALAKTLIATMMVTNVAPTMKVFAGTNDHKGIVKSVEQKRNVMYYGDWSVWGGQGNFYPQDIPADQLTHLNFAFLDFDSEGNLIFTDKDAATGNPLGQAGVTWGDVNAGILPALVELRAQNPNLKIGVSIGGWSKSGDFSEVAANPAKRARFVENVMKFVEYTNMDFVDIDWEYPASVRQPDLVDNKNDEGTPHSRPEDKENYILLLQDLRDALNQKEIELGKTYELSVALPASRDKLADGVDIQKMFEIIDFGNLMTYDMRGAFDPISGHQTPLYPNSNDPYIDRGYSIDQVVDYMITQGAPAEKLVVGAAYYTRGWEQVSGGTDAANPGLFGEAAIVGKDADQTPSRGANNELPVANGDGGRRGGVWSYRNLDRLKGTYAGLKEYWDDEAKAPYLYSAQTVAFFTYDNVRSVTEKANYVNANDLGGVIAWMASNDAPTTSSKRDELTKATKKALFGNGKLTEHEIVYADLAIEVAIRPYNEAWGNTGGYEISIKNNERLEESGEVLSSVEKMAETITLPKLYIKHTGNPLMSGDYTAGTVTQEGDYTVVDFGGIWDGKAIEPGQTYNFKLKTTGQVEDISAIESIEMVQRISKSGEEIKRQTIYGDMVQGNQAPAIKGANDKTITVGQTFDPMAGITALDKEDGDLTAKVKVEGEVNVNEVGTYTLTYTVTDSEGLQTTVIRTITVQAKLPNQAPVLNGVTDQTIKLGEAFDPMAGVTATDQEDGNLTSQIVVEGEVNVNQAGTYTLTYTVADSEGAQTTKTRTITVEEVVAPPV